MLAVLVVETVVSGLVILGLLLHLSSAHCHGWVDGWRVGYDEGHADASAGRPRNPTRKTC